MTNFLRNRIAGLDDPRSIGEALTGLILGHLWKYRVGDYRIVCDIRDGTLTILALRVGNRRDVYRRRADCRRLRLFGSPVPIEAFV